METEFLQQKPISRQVIPLLQRQVEEEREEEEILQAMNFSPLTLEVTPDVEANVRALNSNGQPLSQSTRHYFEPRFGYDFNRVRIHANSQAFEMASKLQAQAFTRANDIVFGAGRFQPGTEAGKRLLGHELTHVIQQNGGYQHNPLINVCGKGPIYPDLHKEAVFPPCAQRLPTRGVAPPCERIRARLNEVIRQLEPIESQIEDIQQWIEEGNRHRAERSERQEWEWQITVRENQRRQAGLEVRRDQLRREEQSLREAFRSACGYEFPTRRRREAGQKG